MGLHNTAHYLKSKGRGADTELVHMSKNEIKGLQQLAKATGGSLTVNPETGLVEAGLLEQVLPVVAAAAATYLTAGAAAPVLATALEGTALAGSAGILAGAGAGALIGGASSALQHGNVGTGMLYGGLGGALAGGMGAYDVPSPEALAGATQQSATGAGAASSQADAVKSGLSYTPTEGYGEAVRAPMTQQQFSDLSAFTGTPQAPGTVPAGMPSPTIQSTPTPAEISQIRGITPTPGAAQPSMYSGYGTMGKTLTLAAPGIGAQMGAMTPPSSVPLSTSLDPYEQQLQGYKMSANYSPYVAPRPNPYYRAQYPTYAAEGGIMKMAGGGPVEQMTQNMLGGQGNMYPQSQQINTNFATPTQMPASAEIIRSDYDAKTNPYTGVMMAAGGQPEDYLPKGDAGKYVDTDASTKGLSALDATNYRNKQLMKRFGVKMANMPKTGIKALGGDMSDTAAQGGLSHLGGYSDGGRMLKGPGDGMSDSIPATIGNKQPARLADGEFVVPADVVSHLGNGSTDAGAKKLYGMMDKIRRARTGKKKQAPAVKADKYLPQ